MEKIKKILITGGAGFIGSHTAVALAESGFEPVIIDDLRNSDISVLKGITKITGKKPLFFQGDCCNSVFLESVSGQVGPIDGVIHFAALKAVGESVAKPLEYYRNNLDSLLAILEWMRTQNVQNLIFSSSATVYGDPQKLPLTENDPRKEASSPYGNTKKIAEDIIFDVAKSKSFPLKAALLRYFNPIGAHPSARIGELPLGTPNNLVPYLTQAAAQKRGPLTVFGNDYPTPDGSGVRDYIHVMDLAEAHVATLSFLLQKDSKAIFCSAFNVGTGNGTSVLELIAKFEKETGVKVPYSIGSRRNGDVAACWADATKIAREVGWHAKRSVSEALRDAWRWEKSRK